MLLKHETQTKSVSERPSLHSAMVCPLGGVLADDAKSGTRPLISTLERHRPSYMLIAGPKACPGAACITSGAGGGAVIDMERLCCRAAQIQPPGRALGTSGRCRLFFILVQEVSLY